MHRSVRIHVGGSEHKDIRVEDCCGELAVASIPSNSHPLFVDHVLYLMLKSIHVLVASAFNFSVHFDNL